MKGKRGLIMGVANERSIAWGISQKLAEAGAELAFTYLARNFKEEIDNINEYDIPTNRQAKKNTLENVFDIIAKEIRTN